MTGKEALIILSKCCSALAFEEGKWKINKRDNEALQILKEIVVKYDKYKRAFEIFKDTVDLKNGFWKEVEINGVVEMRYFCRVDTIFISFTKEEYELLEELMKDE